MMHEMQHGMMQQKDAVMMEMWETLTDDQKTADPASGQVRRYACVIPHFARPRVLLLQSAGEWGLPSAAVAGPPQRNPTSKLRKVLDACGIAHAKVSLLRFARLSSELTVWQCQNDDESWRPPAHGRWVNRHELSDLKLADPTIS